MSGDYQCSDENKHRQGIKNVTGRGEGSGKASDKITISSLLSEDQKDGGE